MKKSIIIIAAILLMAGFTTNLMAQTSATTNAAAKILTGLTITKNVDLNFGSMTIPTAATTVTLSPVGVRTSAGNITLLAQAPLATASAYSVTGDAGASYAITLPSSSNIFLSPSGSIIVVDNFTSSKTGNTSTMSGSGTDSFTVGATINLANGQYAGTYNGTFDVAIAYN